VAGGRQLQTKQLLQPELIVLGKMVLVQNIPKSVDCGHKNLGNITEEYAL
jgi:hypothetical protein